MSKEHSDECLQCSCDWADCSMFSEQIAKHAPLNHPWKGNAYLWRIKVRKGKRFLEKMVLLSAMCHHVPGIADKVVKGRRQFILARHHFPMPAFDHLRKPEMAVLMSYKEMKILAANDNSLRFQEKCNGVGPMVRSLTKYLKHGNLYDAFTSQLEKLSPEDMKKFICSPVETRMGVCDIVNAFYRVRKQRLPFKNTESLLPGASISTKKMANLLVARKEAPSSISAIASNISLSAKNIFFEDSPEPIESQDECITHVKRKVDAVGLEGARSNPKFAKRINLLRFVHCDFAPITLASNKGFLYPCSNTNTNNKSNCRTCRVLKIKLSAGRLCDGCQREKNASNRKEWKLNKECLDASTNRKSNGLGNNGLIKALQVTRKKVYQLEKKIMRLQTCLEKYHKRENEVHVSASSDANEMILQAFAFANTDRDSFCETVIKALVALQQGGDVDSTTEEMNVFAEYLANEIGNKAKVVAHEMKNNKEGSLLSFKKTKPPNVRYLPSTINIAMNIFLQSRKSYNDFSKRSLILIPSTRYLQKLKAPFCSKEGENPSVYSTWVDGVTSKGFLRCHAGHLCVDEVKLKSDLIWNLADDRLTGFCNVSLSPRSLQDTLGALLSSETSQNAAREKTQHAVMANQWSFRSLRNEVHVSEFFYNTGDMDGDELLRQLLHVVGCYESIGVSIYGLCSDAGGSNECLFNVFRCGKKITDGESILHDDMVSMRNPFDCSRRIWLWHCSTHNLKNVRNNLWRSFESYLPEKYNNKRTKRLMRHKDGVVFGWKQMIESYQRQTTKKKDFKQLSESSDITYQAIYLDGLMLMNASYAKAAFSARMLAEITVHCATGLSVTLDWKEGKVGMIGLGGTGKRYLKYATQFRQAIGEMRDVNSLNLLANVCLLEYLAVTHSIFIERLMNTNWSLTLQNIDEELEAVREAIDFFCKWHSEKALFKAANPMKKDSAWAPHLLAVKTLRNIKIGVSGFFAYARDVLDKENINGIFMVGALHSNQSILESYFGKVRAKNHDSVSKFGTARQGDNAMTLVSVGGSIKTVTEGKGVRDAIYDQWLAERRRNCPNFPMMSEEGIFTPRKLLSLHVRDELCRTEAIGGFSTLLISNSLFTEHAKLSIGSIHESFFKSVITGSDSSFDAKCQQLIRMCWESFDKALEAAASDFKRVYHFHLYDDLCHRIYSESSKFGTDEQIGVAKLYLVLSKLVMTKANEFIQRQQQFFRSSYRTHIQETQDWQYFQKPDVNRFVGWALFSLRIRIRKGKRLITMDEDEESDMMNLLNEMTVRECDVMENKNYLQQYYPLFDRLYNEGGLTLISPTYIELGFKILTAITQQIDYDNLASEHGDFVKKARDEVAEIVEKKLIKEFLDLTEYHPLGEDLRRFLFRKIVRKTFNARMGAFIRQYKCEAIGRGTTGERHALREDLKHTSGANAARKKRKLTT